MSDALGISNFCSLCKGSAEENGQMVCKSKEGVFYNLPVKNVLCAPCIKPKKQKRRMYETNTI